MSVQALTFTIACPCGAPLDLINSARSVTAKGVGSQAIAILRCDRHGEFTAQVKLIRNTQTLGTNQVRKDRAERLRGAS